MTCLIGVVVAGSLAKLGNAMPVATVAAVASDTSRAIRPILFSVMVLSLRYGSNVTLKHQLAQTSTIGTAYDSNLAQCGETAPARSIVPIALAWELKQAGQIADGRRIRGQILLIIKHQGIGQPVAAAT